MSHTPGPWTYNPHGGHEEVYGHPIGAGSHSAVAVVNDDTTDGEVSETNAANGRLIASAPDLLAACEAVLADLGTRGGTGGFRTATVEALLAAVQKAWGER